MSLQFDSAILTLCFFFRRIDSSPTQDENDESFK